MNAINNQLHKYIEDMLSCNSYLLLPPLAVSVKVTGENASLSMWPREAFSGAQALRTSGADMIAGLVGSIHEAGRVRDMREYPFWARGGNVH